ncbi:MAG: ABC transporter ATP-binding protein, partial [Ignavibacteria bacterium]|nr:ABC transporter ATP-binding protein [Ignavibacteria bacterium]
MTLGNLLLRFVRAAVPLVMLYIGKLIINEVVRLIQFQGDRNFTHLWILVGAEFAVALLSDVLGRCVALLDSLLGDLFSNKTSVRLMEHAAALDMHHFEDSTFYDKLERARQQTVGRTQ